MSNCILYCKSFSSDHHIIFDGINKWIWFYASHRCHSQWTLQYWHSKIAVEKETIPVDLKIIPKRMTFLTKHVKHCTIIWYGWHFEIVTRINLVAWLNQCSNWLLDLSIFSQRQPLTMHRHSKIDWNFKAIQWIKRTFFGYSDRFENGTRLL